MKLSINITILSLILLSWKDWEWYADNKYRIY